MLDHFLRQGAHESHVYSLGAHFPVGHFHSTSKTTFVHRLPVNVSPVVDLDEASAALNVATETPVREFDAPELSQGSWTLGIKVARHHPPDFFVALQNTGVHIALQRHLRKSMGDAQDAVFGSVNEWNNPWLDLCLPPRRDSTKILLQ